MAYKSFGLFIPTECEQSELEVLSGTALPSHLTPTICDINESIISPYAEKLTTNKGFLEIECLAGYADNNNYPSDRPQVSGEIYAMNNTNAGISSFQIGVPSIDPGASTKCLNNDRGNMLIQNCGGMYKDHKFRGNVSWKRLPSVGFNGKSRPPVMDYLESALFYAFDEETRYINVHYPSIYSDGDYVYAVAMVQWGETAPLSNISAKICFFVFDPYRNIFIQRSDITNYIFNGLRTNAGATAFAAGQEYWPVPMSPVVCRIKNFRNKLVCSFMGSPIGDKSVLDLYVYESCDNGFTWTSILTAGYNNFSAYLLNTVAAAFSDFRVRMASDGNDLMIVWGAKYNIAVTGQIRIICSKDGGQTWSYGKDNLAVSLSGNQTDINDIGVSGAGVYPADVNFGLSVDCEGKFIFAKTADGSIVDRYGYSESTYRVALVFVIIDGVNIINTQYFQISNTYPVNIEPWVKQSFANRYIKHITEVSIFSDPVQKEDYMLIKLTQIASSWDAAYIALFKNNQSFNCIVRFKIMLASEWTTNPDWVQTGISSYNSYGDYIIFLEPPNRNNAWFVANKGIVATSNTSTAWHGIVHRGHIMICGTYAIPLGVVAYNQKSYPFIGCFKAWTNIPHQYSISDFYAPMGGAAVADYGLVYTSSSSGAPLIKTITNDRELNELVITINEPAGGPMKLVQEAWSSSGIITGTSAIRGSVIGSQEGVFRFCFSIKNYPNNSDNYVADITVLFRNSTGWQYSNLSWNLRKQAAYGLSPVMTFPHVAVVPNYIVMEEDIFYEFMVVYYCINNTNLTLRHYYRKLNADNISSVVNEWIYFGTSTASFNPYVFGLGYAAWIIGLRTHWINALGSTAVFKWKNIICSKSSNDHYPAICDTPNIDGLTSWNNYISRLIANYKTTGVLSGEYIHSISECSGEYITPEPIWIGTEWLIRVDSNMSKKDAFVWLNLSGSNIEYPGVVGSVGATYVTANSGNLSGRRAYFNGPVVNYVRGGFIMGNGIPLNITMPIALSSYNFNDALRRYSRCGMNFLGAQYLSNSYESENYKVSTDFTVSFWIKINAGPVGPYCIVNEGSAGGVGWSIYWETASGGRFSFVNMFLGTQSYSPSGLYGSVSDIGKWIFVSMIRSGSNIEWFRNGVSFGTSTTDFVNSYLENIAGGVGIEMRIGSTINNTLFFTGYLSIFSMFNRYLSRDEIVELYRIGRNGVTVPSDFFIRVFGESGVKGDRFNLAARNAGGAASNVLNGMVGSQFKSNFGDRYRLHAENSSMSGETEIFICQKLVKTVREYITANAVLIMNCNATDVIIHTTNINPITGATVYPSPPTIMGVFKYADSEYGIPEFLVNEVAAADGDYGVVTNPPSSPDWRPNFYVGERIVYINTPGVLNWPLAPTGVLPPGINGYIGKCISNDSRKMVLDWCGKPIKVGANIIYQLADSLLIVLPNTITARYWRFIFGNNVFNGDKVKVGMIRLGNLVPFDVNPDTPFSINRRIVERDLKSNVQGINVTVPYLKRIKSDFDIRMEHIDTRSDGSDYQKLINTYHTALNSRDGVFLALCNDSAGFMNATVKYFPLIFRCAPDGDLVVENSGMSYKNISIKLKEM